MSKSEQNKTARMVNYLGLKAPSSPGEPLIGVLDGTGIGSEVIGSALQVLASVEQVTGLQFEVRRGTLIGEDALPRFGQWLPEEVVEFCSDIFREGGAILSGPGGGRYVYDLRRRFDLFAKFVPIRPLPELAGAARIVPAYLEGLDILLVRDNAGGVYQVINFTSTSSASCTLYGYPGVSLVTGPPYAQLGSAAKRSITTPVKLITLAPGETAYAQLQIVDALNFPSATCKPTKATNLKVYPPNQTAPVYLADTSYGCAKPVQTMIIGPVQAGSAHPMASPNGEGQ